MSWDGFGRLRPTSQPRVPTMFQHHDLQEFGPHRSPPPDPDVLPGAKDVQLFRQAGVPAMLVTLAGSTHHEWYYIPYSANDPFCPACNSSRDGERVALYYTLAWFDRWLKPGSRQRKDASRRLLARSFDESADRSSIGQGTWDRATRRNKPYLIEGKSVREGLSPFYRSSYAFDGRSCDDLRGGCPR